MSRSFLRGSLVALAFVAINANVAGAGTAYDGRWSLSIITERGTCSTYNFPVDITNGHVSFPGLVRARGHVTRKGSVHVTVAVQDKYAAGSGRLSLGSGHGRWYGRSGRDRCSGSWTAQRS